MRILYIHNDYGGRSGEEVAAEGLATLLTDHGHEVFWFRGKSGFVATSAPRSQMLSPGRERRESVLKPRP